jgi:hypothetical protein
MYTANEMHSMLPPRLAPIDRTPAGAAAFNSQAGATASGFDWGGLISSVLPTALSFL